MSKPLLLLILESPTHPNYVALYEELGFQVEIVTSMRKAMSLLKKKSPAFIVCEFFYGYGNNYAGINLSNLDVMLHALRRYSPNTKVISFYQKEEKPYMEKLKELFDIYADFPLPVSARQLADVLQTSQ